MNNTIRECAAGCRMPFINKEFAMIRWVLATALCAAVGLYCCCSVRPTAQPLGATAAQAASSPAVLFSEGFDDAQLLQRGWYDGSKFTISNAQPYAGKGCIEYAWKTGT